MQRVRAQQDRNRNYRAVVLLADKRFVQLATPDELRGRVSAVNQVFVQASSQVGAMESGFAAAFAGATFAVVSGGVAAVAITAVVAVFMPELWHHRFTTRPIDISRRPEQGAPDKEQLVAAG